VRGLGVDDDEALLVGERLVRTPIVVLLGIAAAIVNAHQQRRLRDQVGWLVNEHLRSALVRTVVGNFLETLGAGRAHESEDGTDDRLHLARPQSTIKG